MAEVTRRKTLELCLEYLDGEKRKISKNGNSREPRDEEAAEKFYELEQMDRIVREIIQDYENQGVRDASARWRDKAKWQRELMDGREPDIRFREGDRGA